MLNFTSKTQRTKFKFAWGNALNRAAHKTPLGALSAERLLTGIL